MPVQWGLANEGVGNPLDSLRYFGLAQQQQQDQVRLQAEQAKLQADQQRRASLAAAYDPATGKLDNRQVSQTLAMSGDIDGFRTFNKGLQGEQAETAKMIGQVAEWADTPEKWGQAINYMTSNGIEVPEQYRQFSEANRMAALAVGGRYDEYMEAQQPKYIPVGENGVVNVRDPAALAAVAAAQGGQPAPQAAPRQAPANQPDAATLTRQAEQAIANGADPVAVRARLQQMLGGAGSGPRTFP